MTPADVAWFTCFAVVRETNFAIEVLALAITGIRWFAIAGCKRTADYGDSRRCRRCNNHGLLLDRALREALEYAEDLSSSPWDFALCPDQAKAFDINGNDLRRMFRKGWLKHRTKNGELVLETTPYEFWNFERRELQIDGKVVKRFGAPAPNQETILSVFSEENWPVRIEDPLTQCPGQDPKRRLADTIKCLNRNQREKLIRFRGDGTGDGVLWEIVERDEQI